METFLEYETCVASHHHGHVFVGSLAEIDPRKVTEVVRGSRHIRSLQYSAIRLDIGSPIVNEGNIIQQLFERLNLAWQFFSTSNQDCGKK